MLHVAVCCAYAAASCLFAAPTPYSVNVRDYGAVGDGVHDDTLALQKAADAARVDSQDRGQLETMVKLRLTCTQDGPVPELYFPKGVYRTTGPVVFTGNAFLRGEDAEIRNETADRDTFFFDLGYRVDIEGLRFAGGRHQVRQFTQNRDIASARISGCTFERSRGTAVRLDCLSDVKVQRSAGKAAFFKSAYETKRTPDGRVELVDVDPASRNPAANSTLVLVEKCTFRDCAQAIFAHSDGVNVDRCSFYDTGVARGPIVQVRTTVSLTRLSFHCSGCVPGRTAIAFGRGCSSAADIDIRAPGGMDPFLFEIPPTYTINYGNYGSSLALRNVTLDTGTNAVLTIGAEYLPEMISLYNVRRVRPHGAKPMLFAFRRAPTREDLESWTAKHRQARHGMKCVFGWAAADVDDYDLEMPAHLAQLRCQAGRKVVKEYLEDSTSGKDAPLFTDEAIGVADARQKQDDSDRVEALLRRAAEAGGGTVLLPPRWITLSRTLDVPRNVRITAAGKAVVRSSDYRLVFFRAGENPDAVFENILFNRGATVFETTADRGRARFENCHFFDQDGVTLKARANGPSEFRLEVRYGTSFVPHLYDGNAAPAVFDAFWLEYAPDFDKAAWDAVSEKSQSCLVNRNGGVLRCYDLLGVPCVYWHAAQSTKNSDQKLGFFTWVAHPEEHPELYGDFRWVDNYGDFTSLNVRYGGEWAGLTPVYQYGDAAKSLLAGHIVGGSLYGWTKAKHATVLSDRKEAHVVLTDLFCMNRMDEPSVVFWRDASGRLSRAKGWVRENCYPHRQKEPVACPAAENVQPKETTAVSRVPAQTKNPARDPGLYGDYWWANRFLSRRKEIEKVRGRDVDLVLLGDSICHFWEWQHPDSWAKLTASRTVLNLGYGGDTTQQVIWRIGHGELDGYKAKTIVLMIGTNNNSSESTNPANVAKGVEKIVSLVRERQPNAKLVLHPIFPRGASAESARHASARARNEATNALLKEFAARDGKIVWIDFNDKLLDESGWVPKELMADEIHPTDRGYDIWMEALAGAGVITPVEDEVFIRSTADKTLQPARFFVPESAKGKKVPLLVALHTWSFGYGSESPWKWAKAQCAKRGWALVYPHFRGSNDKPSACGSDLAVQDVVDAVNYAKRETAIDEGRIYVCGGSGGGHMALLMAGRHPELWAGVVAACPISDLSAWFKESVRLERGYWKKIYDSCGGTPWERRKEYARRSPVTWLARAKEAGVPVQIQTGIHDGHFPGSVPIGHAIRAFNVLANAADAVSDEDIDFMEKNEKVPEPLAFAGRDPFFGEKTRIHMRRTSANARLTIFEGGHSGNFDAGIDWLARQRRGRAVDWSLPETARGSAEALTK